MDLNIAKPLTLKCGLVLPNRLTKAAMAEKMADARGLPTSKLDAVYKEWADGGWGMLLTGNVQVDADHLGSAGDNFVDASIEADLVASWTRFANACKAHKTPVVMQISHPGRQSPLGAGRRSVCAKTLAPSPIPINLGDGLLARSAVGLLFGTPREMTEEDVRHVVNQFTTTARLAAESGFDGVELHAAHGYLLSTFLTAKSNQRTDQYGGSPRNRARIVVEIVDSIRKVVPKSFCVGVKLNSADLQSTEELKESIEQIRYIEEGGVDFLEISGGSYEDPKMMGTGEDAQKPSSRTAAREALFLDFAKAIRSHFPKLPLMVTGGFRTRAGMDAAVSDSACDLVGIGRPAVLQPKLPKEIIFNKVVADEDARVLEKKVKPPYLAKLSGMKGVGAGAVTVWYAGELRKLGQAH